MAVIIRVCTKGEERERGRERENEKREGRERREKGREGARIVCGEKMNKKQATRHSLTHASCVAVGSGALSLLCSPLLPFSSRPLMNMRHHFSKKARHPVDPFFRFFHHPSSPSLSVPPFPFPFLQ